MRIVYLRSNPVNPDSRVEKEVNSLIKHGFAVSVIGWDRGDSYQWRDEELNLPAGKVKIHRIGIKASFGGGIRNLKALVLFNRKVCEWLKNNSECFDIIHAADLDTGFAAYKMARKLGKKYIYDIFDYYPDTHSFPLFIKRLAIWAEKKTIENAECTILCTEQRKAQIYKTKPRRILIIHNSPSKDIFENNESKFKLKSNNKHAIKIGYVGILSRSRLLEEITEVIKDEDSFELHIGGFGQLESFFIDADREYENVFFYGKISYEETLQLENKMDVLTAIYDPSIPNHRFAAPNKFYESLMLGKPIIMIHNTGVDSYVDEYQIGVTIDFSLSDFKKAIQRIKENMPLWSERANVEKQLFDVYFSWEIMERRLIDLYSQLS